MRQLVEKISFKSKGVTDEIYLSENIRCQECHRTVPVGIEVITVQKAGENSKVIKHRYYCRAHGSEYHD